MRKELEQRFANRWPKWFDLDGDPHETCMSRGFEHGDGWFDLVWRLCKQIEGVVEEGKPFKVTQVKEKFGELRFYIDGGNEAVFELIEIATEASRHICVVCGQPGRRRDDGWVRTKCDELA
jgi:hypothetical protein